MPINRMKKHVAIIDYGMGNLHSVASAVKHVAPDAHITISADTQDIFQADHVILPGVGAIRDCMSSINDNGIPQVVNHVIEQKQPLLGICVGMQLLQSHSEENQGVDCLDIFKGEVKRFPQNVEDAGLPIKVPHMGWNHVEKAQEHPLWEGIASGTRFYFVHSYFVEPNPTYAIGSCHYGVPFSAMMAKDSVAAVQFHPEKSHMAGLRLLRNFLNWQV